MKTFELLDISGDAGIRAYGETMEDLFVNAATGMYSLVTNPEDIREQREISLEIESHSVEGLIVSWLNELIFQLDAYGFLGKKINVKSMLDNRISAVISGEDFDPQRHETRLLIKAATYHMLKIEKQEGQWSASVIFDI